MVKSLQRAGIQAFLSAAVILVLIALQPTPNPGIVIGALAIIALNVVTLAWHVLRAE